MWLNSDFFRTYLVIYDRDDYYSLHIVVPNHLPEIWRHIWQWMLRDYELPQFMETLQKKTCLDGGLLLGWVSLFKKNYSKPVGR